MDLYAVLGRRGAASQRRAYRRLARRYHPGINPGDPEAQARFAEITRAFETLSDPERRRAYDAGVVAGDGAAVDGVRLRGVRFLGGGRLGARRRPPSASCSRTCFGPRAAGGGPEPGADLHAALTAVVRGGAARRRALRAGDPPGRLPHVRRGRRDCGPSPCRARRATGTRADPLGSWAHGVRQALRGVPGSRAACAQAPAGRAAARASRRAPRACTCACRPASSDGVEMRWPGAGTRGAAAAGPATCTCGAGRPHPLFRREGDDLHLVVPVAVHEAALGRGSRSRRSTARCACGSRRARSRGSAFGCASGASPRCARPARRPDRRGAAGPAGRARRAVEGAAARVRADQRRRRAARAVGTARA